MYTHTHKQECAEKILSQDPSINVRSRGRVMVKGKGIMHTYWIKLDGHGADMVMTLRMFVLRVTVSLHLCACVCVCMYVCMHVNVHTNIHSMSISFVHA